MKAGEGRILFLHGSSIGVSWEFPDGGVSLSASEVLLVLAETLRFIGVVLGTTSLFALY